MSLSPTPTPACSAQATSKPVSPPTARRRKATRGRPVVAKALLFVVAALGLPGAASAANLFADFSPTSNPNGAWTYGSAASPGAAFTAHTFAAANNLDGVHVGMQGWSLGLATLPMIGINISGGLIDDGNVSLPTGTVLLHGRGTDPQASVVRWAAPQAGAYQVNALFTGHQRNMQANVAVFNGDATVYSNSIAGLGASASFSAVVNVLAGGALTFSVNRGSADANGFAGNWTGLDLDITAAPVPEPGSIALMLAGLGCLGFVARRRRV